MHAGRVRLRPILMTTFALIAGMMPVAIGVGEGGEFYRRWPCRYRRHDHLDAADVARGADVLRSARGNEETRARLGGASTRADAHGSCAVGGWRLTRAWPFFQTLI